MTAGPRRVTTFLLAALLWSLGLFALLRSPWVEERLVLPLTQLQKQYYRAILERNGSSLERVVKCTAFLADMGEWARMNAVYRRYFTSHLPARSALGAAGLAFGARLELECIATVGAGR